MSEVDVKGGATRPWAVGALVAALADALAARFNPVTVHGEVSGFSQASSGHCYFTLKDAQGQLRCALFRRSAQALARLPADGQRVQVQGRIDVYAPRGDLQLIAERVMPVGQGLLMEQFLALKARLEAEGLFAAERKRPLPPMPQSVAVVTSAAAAAWRDVVAALRRRAPHVGVVLFPALVQGVEAAASLVQALRAAYRWHEAVGQSTVLLLVRGGGSLEDLWPFNDEAVVRTLAQAPMPTVSGVGHETDFTLVDFVADVRAPTPTAAAELCAVQREVWLRALRGQQERLQRGAWAVVDRQAQRLDAVAARLVRPAQQLALQRLRLQQLHRDWSRGMLQTWQRHAQSYQALERRLSDTVQHALAQRRQLLAHHEAVLAALDPGLVLQRGYAWLRRSDGRALVRAAEARAGDALTAVMADGEVDLRVC